MANKKLPRHLKKKVKSYSIRTDIAEAFEAFGSIHGFVPSNKVEELMANFNNTLIKE